MPTWRGRSVSNPLGVIASSRNLQLASEQLAAEPTFEPPREPEEQTAEASVVRSVVYADGSVAAEPESLQDAFATVRRLGAERQQALAWIGMTSPTAGQLQRAAEVFDLHPLAVEDAIIAHQRPKLERYGDTLFLVLRPAAYDDATETVMFGEVHAFIGPDFVITVRHTARPELAAVRDRFENDRQLLARGPQAVLYGLLDFVVDGYAPVISGLENDIDEIETQVFESDPNVSRRIYELSQEVMELQRAVKPLQTMLRGLDKGAEKHGTDEETVNSLRDVLDHITSIVERTDGFRQSLSEILQLNAILVAQTQNEEMKRLAEVANTQAEEVKRASSWAAILFAPTIVAGIYGMNFERMPELHWVFGYGFALGLMFTVSFIMWLMFKRKNWL